MNYLTIYAVFMLAIVSCFDVLYQRIPQKLIGGFLVGSVLGKCLLAEGTMKGSILGVMIGVGMLLWAKFSKESIGYGDGFILCGQGILFEFEGVLEILMYALLLAALFAIFLLTIGKKNRKETIPFIPFLGVGTLLLLLRKGLM